MLLLDYKAVCAGLFLYRGKNECCRAKYSKVIGKWRKQFSIVCSTSTNILKMEKLFFSPKFWGVVYTVLFPDYKDTSLCCTSRLLEGCCCCFFVNWRWMSTFFSKSSVKIFLLFVIFDQFSKHFKCFFFIISISFIVM